MTTTTDPQVELLRISNDLAAQRWGWEMLAHTICLYNAGDVCQYEYTYRTDYPESPMVGRVTFEDGKWTLSIPADETMRLWITTMEWSDGSRPR